MVKEISAKSFNIDGWFSNGVGWVSLCTYPVNKLISLLNSPMTLTLFSFLQLSIISKSYWKNDVLETIEVSLSDIEEFMPNINDLSFRKMLETLEEMDMISFEKFEGKDVWQITVKDK